MVYVSTSSVLFPLLLGLYSRNWTSKFSNLLVILCCASMLSDIISLALTHYKINNWPVGNLFLFIQFIILFILVSDNNKNLLLSGAFFLCIIFSVLDFFILQTPTTFNSYSAYANGILMIILSLRFLYWLMIDMPAERVQSLPLFWLSFGVLFYYGGNIFLFLFNNYLMEHSPNSHKSIWMLHNLLNISKNSLFFIGIWANYKTRTSRQ